MNKEPGCGQGLAENSVLPARLAEVMAAMAENLRAHMETLVLTDPNARQEYQAYMRLWVEQTEIADLLRTNADHMAGYIDLPAAEHDMQKLTDAPVREAFERLVEAKHKLRTLLDMNEEGDRVMLTEMEEASSAAQRH